LLFEGAQGIHLDIDYGTYPYVTSSGVGPAAIPQSCALPNLHLDKIVMVVKCYTTRVGEGPFLSEIPQFPDGTMCTSQKTQEYHDSICGEGYYERSCDPEAPRIELKSRDGKIYYEDCKCQWCTSHQIREKGGEYGTTTGRPRRIGWFDLQLIKRSVELTGATEIALMHTDTLAGMLELKCVNLDGNLETHEGWEETTLDDKNLCSFIERIQCDLGITVTMVSYGPNREQIHIRNP